MKSAKMSIAALCVMAALPSARSTCGAEEFSPAAPPRAGETTHVEATLQVGGDLKLAVPAKQDRSLPMSVAASLDYDEQILPSPPQEPATLRSLRYYRLGQATIKVDKGGEKPTLPDNRRTIAVQVAGSAATLYSPQGPLTRENLDLVDIPGNTLVLHRLLPEKPVAIGASWKHDDQLLAALLGLEVVSVTDVKSVLSKIEKGVAKMVLEGHVSGAIGGVGTEIDLKAKYNVDLKTNRITWFALLVKEKRASGHVNPGLDVVAKLVVKMSPRAAQPLSERVTAKLPMSPTGENLALEYRSRMGQFGFGYSRDWYITGDDGDLVVLRYVDRGDLIGQCNVTLLKPEDAKKPLTLADFQRDIEQTLGKNFGQFASADEFTAAEGVRVYRVVCHGKSGNLPIEWIYYLLSDAQHRRLSCAFTVEQRLADKFEGADKALVSQIQFSKPAPETAVRPAKTR